MVKHEDDCIFNGKAKESLCGIKKNIYIYLRLTPLTAAMISIS